MYAVLCILGVLFVIGYVPETKGRDLDSIGNLFLKRNGRKCENNGGGVVAGSDSKRKGEEIEITRL